VQRLPVIYTDDARSDLSVIFAIVLEMSRSLLTAERFVRRIEERCYRIGDAPRGGAPRDDIVPGLRIVPFEKRAVIAYFVDEDAVIISNIFYGGVDYEALLGTRPSRWPR
jgi:toxin ParE1/3/4